MSGEFLPLPMAAAVAYLRLVSHQDRGSASEGLLDVVAPRVRLADELVAHGRLCNGATRLRFRDGTPPLENLAILQSDLEAGIRRLEGAGVRFSDAMLEQAPRRVPRVLPSTT